MSSVLFLSHSVHLAYRKLPQQRLKCDCTLK